MIAEGKKDLEKLLHDKGNKKALLFYTDMEKWINPDEKRIQRLKSVLEYLKERKDVYTLWDCSAGACQNRHFNGDVIWDIAEECKDCKNIICFFQQDKRSLCLELADAYYGDYSGYVFDFLLQDKPLLICNWNVSEEVWSQALPKVQFERFAAYNDWMYFSSSLSNGLFRGNLKTEQTEFLGCFPKESLEQSFLYTGCARYENKIIFAPGMAECIALYDMQCNAIEMIELPDIEYKFRDRKKFSDVFVFEHFAFFIPNRMPVIMKLDMNTCEVKLLTEWYEESLDEMLFPGDMLFTGDYAITDEKCYLPYCQKNMVLEVDLRSDETKFHRVGREETFFNTIAYDGELFWITGGMNYAVSWNCKTGETEEYPYPGGFDSGYNPFVFSVYQDGEVMLIPETANMWLKIDAPGKRVTEMRIEHTLCQAEKARVGFYLQRNRGGHLLSCFYNGKTLQLEHDWSVKKEIYYAHPFASVDNFCVGSTYNREVREKTGDFSQLQLLIENTKINRKSNLSEDKRMHDTGQKIYGIVKAMQERED